MSDIVTIECPNCGGKVERKADEYFAKCQFCGGEVCFDDIKEEVQLGVYKKKINKYENKIDSYEKTLADDQSKRNALKKWIFRRNVALTITTLSIFVGFGTIEMSIQNRVEIGEDMLSTLGALFFFFGLVAHVIAPFTLAAFYPSYDLLNRTDEKAGKAKTLIKLLGASALLAFLAVIISTIIVLLVTEY